MPRNVLRFLTYIFIASFCYGCASTKGITTRAYMQDKQRVDQELQGSLGNWQSSVPVENKSKKDTRKIYILEVTQDDGTGTDMMTEDFTTSTTTSSSPAYYSEPLQATQKTITPPRATMPSIPTFSDDDLTYEQIESISQPVVPSQSSGSSFVDYTVEKDDTLQKISKKFYNSFSKWPKIYEANRAKIKDPDHIKPGISIRIPIE